MRHANKSQLKEFPNILTYLSRLTKSSIYQYNKSIKLSWKISRVSRAKSGTADFRAMTPCPLTIMCDHSMLRNILWSSEECKVHYSAELQIPDTQTVTRSECQADSKQRFFSITICTPTTC